MARMWYRSRFAIAWSNRCLLCLFNPYHGEPPSPDERREAAIERGGEQEEIERAWKESSGARIDTTPVTLGWFERGWIAHAAEHPDPRDAYFGAPEHPETGEREVCPDCDGKGDWSDLDSTDDRLCGRCKGSGRVPPAEPLQDGGEREQRYERIAKEFHQAYEELAPVFGYRTREESAKPWKDVPRQNQLLMTATVKALIEEDIIRFNNPVSAEHPHQDVQREQAAINEFDARVVVPELQEDVERLREALRLVANMDARTVSVGELAAIRAAARAASSRRGRLGYGYRCKACESIRHRRRKEREGSEFAAPNEQEGEMDR